MFSKRILKSLSLLALSLCSLAPVANAEAPLYLNNKIKASFAATYLDSGLTPKPKDEKIDPYSYRINPDGQYALTRGIIFTKFEFYTNYLKFTVYNKGIPIATVFTIKSSQMPNFNISNINKEFQGTIEAGSNNGLLSTPTVLVNLTNECMDPKFTYKKFEDTIFSHIDCANRGVELFITRPENKTIISQTFASKYTKSNDEHAKDSSKNLVLINYHDNHKEPFNFKEPFETLTKVPLPTEAMAYYLDNMPASSNIDSQTLENFKKELAKDNYKLKQQIENILLEEQLDNTIMTLDIAKAFNSLSIKRSEDASELKLVNITPNLFNSTLTVYSNKKKDIVASSFLTLPLLHSSMSISDLAYNIANDVNCMSDNRPEEIKTWDLTGYKITCTKTFGTNNLAKTYYLYNTESTNKEKKTPESLPLYVVMFLGKSKPSDINDIVFNIELSNDKFWNIDFNKLSEYELIKIFEIPNTENWFVNTDGDNTDTDTPWGQFVYRSKETLKQLSDHSADSVFKALSGVASELHNEILEKEAKEKEEDD